MDNIYLIIAITFFGFVALAFGLLFPVYRFLHREEHAAKDWTDDAIARRQRRPPAEGPPGAVGDGASGPPPDPPRP